MKNKEYGVSSKFCGHEWDHVVYGPFDSDAEAEEWLYAEEGDFRERELMNREDAVEVAGERAVETGWDNLAGHRSIKKMLEEEKKFFNL